MYDFLLLAYSFANLLLHPPFPLCTPSPFSIPPSSNCLRFDPHYRPFFSPLAHLPPRTTMTHHCLYFFFPGHLFSIDHHYHHPPSISRRSRISSSALTTRLSFRSFPPLYSNPLPTFVCHQSYLHAIRLSYFVSFPWNSSGNLFYKISYISIDRYVIERRNKYVNSNHLLLSFNFLITFHPDLFLIFFSYSTIHSYTDLAIILSTFPVYVQFNSLYARTFLYSSFEPSQEDRVQTRVQASPPRVIPRVRLSVTKPDLSPAYESEFSSWNFSLSLSYCNYTYNDFPPPWRFVINHNRLRSVEPEWMHTPRFRGKLSPLDVVANIFEWKKKEMEKKEGGKK